MHETLTLREAADRLGVSHSVLKKLIRAGQLPEAAKVQTDTGRMWTIPVEALPEIAQREGLIVDLTGDEATGVELTPSLHAAADPVPTAMEADPSLAKVIDMRRSDDDGPPSLAEVIDVALLDRLLMTQQEAATAAAQAEMASREVETVSARRSEMETLLTAERDGRAMTDGLYQEERLARSVADARTSELRDRVAREMQIADSERQVAREATLARLRAEREAAEALAAMGRRARRRFQKRYP